MLRRVRCIYWQQDANFSFLRLSQYAMVQTRLCSSHACYDLAASHKICLFSLSTQKRGADDRENKIRKQYSKTNICQKMTGHMNPVIAVENDKYTSD